MHTLVSLILEMGRAQNSLWMQQDHVRIFIPSLKTIATMVPEIKAFNLLIHPLSQVMHIVIMQWLYKFTLT